jgi:tetratricopeptide (TPR) repeat protein
MKVKIYLIIISFLLTGCGFTSGLYKDILKAQDFIETREFNKATKIYENILERKPGKIINIKINYQLGEINSIYLNNYKKALIHFEKVIKLANEPLWQVKALEKIGVISYENLKDYKKSQYAYKKLMKFIPKLEKQDFYKFRYAQSLYQKELYDNAIKIFKELTQVKNSKYSVQSYYFLGLINFYKKNWEQSISYWFEYLKREKRQDRIVQVKFMIANAYESSEQLKQAYNIYYSIIGNYPNPEVIRSRLNSLYARRVARKR